MNTVTTSPTTPTVQGRGRIAALWSAITGILGAIAGVAPHVLHHVGLLAGTALVAGATGTILFAVLGLAASIPLLHRLYRRFNTWRAPAIGVAVFAALFSLSAFVIGPAINDNGTSPTPSVTTVDHQSHHS